MLIRVIIQLCALIQLSGLLSAQEGSRVSGDAETLRARLYSSPEARSQQLLTAAARALADGNAQIGLEAIQRILSNSSDEFTASTDNQGEQTGLNQRSVRERAEQLLQQQPPTVRIQWENRAQREASGELQEALAGDRKALLKLLHEWPFTSVGDTALLSLTKSAFTRGEWEQATSYVALARQRDVPIEHITEQLPDLPVSAVGGGQQIATANNLSRPAPNRLWQWSESVWDEPQLVSSAGGLNQPDLIPALEENVWQVQITNDLVIGRTPLRIVALNKASGNVVWSLKTDTIQRPDYLSNDPSITLSPAELARMSTLGRLTIQGNRVYFYDGFQPLQRGTRPFGARLPAMHIRSKLQPTRLVALDLLPQPRIRWIAGPKPAADYILTTAAGESVLQSPSPLAAQNTNFEFSGLPVVSGECVFALANESESHWVRCLSHQTGELLWEQPVAFRVGNQRGARFSGARKESGFCGVAGNVVVVALSSELAVGLSRIDGRLLWANSTHHAFDNATTRRLVQDDPRPFEPRVIHGRLLWSPPPSRDLYCLDTETGKTLWQVPRQPEGASMLKGSHDTYCAYEGAASLILVGSRHIRAIRHSDGQTIWKLGIPAQTGRGIATANSCLLPIADGSVIAIDLETGTLAGKLPQLESDGVIGGLSSNGSLICATTPTSVQAFEASAAQLERQPQALASLNHSRLLWRAGREDEAIEELLLIAGANGNESAAATQVAVEVLLSNLAAARFEADDSVDVGLTLARLNRFSLTNVQSLRRQILTAGQIPPDALSVIPINADWWIRADVASQELNSSPPQLPPVGTTHWLERQTLIPHASDEAVRLATEMRSKWPEGAESVLLRTPEPNEKTKRFLNELRGSNARSTSIDLRQPPEPSAIHFSEQMLLYNESRLAELLEGASDIPHLPSWHRDRLAVIQVDGQREVYRLDAMTGAVSTGRRLPAPLTVMDAEPNASAPGLLPMFDAETVGMLSLLHKGAPQVLWSRRLPVSGAEIMPVIPGTVGPSFFTVMAGESLFCLHPVTGSVLWRRRLPAGPPATTYMALQPYIFGDSDVTGVIGVQQNACAVYSTRTGQFLREIPLETDPFSAPESDGRRLLFRRITTAGTSSIHLLDISSGTDLLKDKNISSIRQSGLLHLPEHRAVVLTTDEKLKILNTETGEIEFALDVTDRLPADRGRALTAVTRDGLAFVSIGDIRSLDSVYSADGRYSFDRLADGRLFCIHLETGRLLWDQRTVACQMPRVLGDPGSLILSWSWLDPNTFQARQNLEPRLRARRYRSLKIDLRHPQTGEILASNDILVAREPLRVRHDAKRQEYLLETDRSRVTISYGPKEPGR